MLEIGIENAVTHAEPLQRLTVTGAKGREIRVTDGSGREYARIPATPEAVFMAAGAVGTHTLEDMDAAGKVIATATFQLEAPSKVVDGGDFEELFHFLYKGMCCYSPTGVEAVPWKGRDYRIYVGWVLDHLHTLKGMRYFDGFGGEMVDLFRSTQRADGMIWSNILQGDGAYQTTAYGPWGYMGPKEGDRYFTRQPAENHCEYLYVNVLYYAWQGNGDDAWMEAGIDSAARALDYGRNDGARWSEKFGLLKRAHTVDSWDFQIDDEYLVPQPVASMMIIDPDKTKFGIFFGDNTGYAQACDQLAEMMRHAGREADAQNYTNRAAEIRANLDNVAWNGRFYTHFIEEDETVHRNLGVDESAQIAHSNCYSVNRGVSHEQAKAILETYLDLKAHLPHRSPGEWYAIYPPYERGMGWDNDKWQYMNGGIAGHAAGELARGAFDHGYETYGVDILRRILDLGTKYPGDRLWFAYTGCIPEAPPPPNYTPVSLADAAEMDITDEGAAGAMRWMNDKRPGNDMRGLPVGKQTFCNIPFEVADPAQNGRRAVAAVSTLEGYPAVKEVPVNASAAAIHLLHTVGNLGPSGLAGVVTFKYEDGAAAAHYLRSGQELAGWWFPALNNATASVAWSGPNLVSSKVGVCWAVIANPHPEKRIAAIEFSASADGAVYALMGLTLADAPHYVEPNPVSGGGPDNWSAGTAMGALMEGLVGVTDEATKYTRARVAPRWTAAGVQNVEATVRYGASDGYVSYCFSHNAGACALVLAVTGSGDALDVHMLLPAEATGVESVTVNDSPHPFEESRIESSIYADFSISLPHPSLVTVKYRV